MGSHGLQRRVHRRAICLNRTTRYFSVQEVSGRLPVEYRTELLFLVNNVYTWRDLKRLADLLHIELSEAALILGHRYCNCCMWRRALTLFVKWTRIPGTTWEQWRAIKEQLKEV